MLSTPKILMTVKYWSSWHRFLYIYVVDSLRKRVFWLNGYISVALSCDLGQSSRNHQSDSWENRTRTEHNIYVIIPLSWELKFMLNEVLSEGSTVIVYEQRVLLWHPLNIMQLIYKYKRLTKICLVGTVQLASLLIISLMAATVLFICYVVLMTTWILS